VVSINASSLGNPADSVTFARALPRDIQLTAPWLPLLPAHPAVPISVADQLHALDSGGMRLAGDCLRYLTGVGSPLAELRSRILPFVRAVTNAKTFRLISDHPGMSGSSVFSVAEFCSSVDIARSRLSRIYHTAAEAEEDVRTLFKQMETAQAAADFAMLEALDMCAILGGRELPNWAPNAAYVGARLGPGVEMGSVTDERFVKQARARKLERWGVPLWCKVPRAVTVDFRLDVMAGGRPVKSMPETERRYQGILSKARQTIGPDRISQELIPATYHEAARPHAPASAVLPTGEKRVLLERAIRHLIDPASRVRWPYGVFNREVGALLGGDVWSGQRYEGSLHASFNPHETACHRWATIRDGVQECGHIGALIAAFEIPQPWHDAKSWVANDLGLEVDKDWAPDATPVMLSVPLGCWYGVDVSGFAESQAEEALAEARKYRSIGALGWRFIQAEAAKKEGARSVPRSNWRLQVLSKTKATQGDVSRKLREVFPINAVLELDVRWSNESPMRQYEFHVDPGYVDRLFSALLPAEDHQLLVDIGPVYGVPPIKAAGVGMDVRDEAEARYLVNLCCEGIFEYNGAFPPAIAAPAPPSLAKSCAEMGPADRGGPRAQPSALPSPSFDMCQITLELFMQLAFAPDIDALSPFETLRFRRLALLLFACKRGAPFGARVFPSAGAPYRCILQYVCRAIFSRRDVVGYNYATARQLGGASAAAEMLKLKSDGRVQIFMRFNSPLDPCPLPTREEIDKYRSGFFEKAFLTPAQKRRKRKEKRVA
jgi:hypothetical protein